MKYPVPRENISLADLPVEVFKKVRSNRRRVCASNKHKYAWMRFDTCTEVPQQKVDTKPIQSSKDMARLLHGSVPFQGRSREYFMVISMDTKNNPIGVALLHIGGRSSAVVDASVVLQAVLLSGGTSFIVAHNHPSGNSDPSPEDGAVTARIKNASKAVGLFFLDHLVLTDHESDYFSFADHGRMPE